MRRKKNDIKSHNFVFQLQTFFLNFFFQSKEKRQRQSTPHYPPPSPSHLPLQNRQPLKVMGFFSQYNPQCFSRRISAHWLRITQHDNAMLRFAKTLDDGDGDEEEKWEEGRRRVCGRKMGWGG